jgi:anthranilate synthase component 1
MTSDFEFAADLETPVSAFLKLTPLDPVFLLESVDKNETIGRYSFIGILPNQFFVLEKPDASSAFFASLSECLRELKPGAATRLSTGLVGFFSYHAAALLHPKLQMKPSPYPLAAFVLPSAILAFDHFNHRVLLSSILPEAEQFDLAKQIRACLLQTIVPLPCSGKSSEPHSNLSTNEFCKLVERAHEYVAAGDIFQVVLSMQFQGESLAHPFQMYRALRMINPSPYMFFFNFKNQFQFFGSSPETMVRTEGKKVILRPIAGTRRRSLDLKEDETLENELLNDEKEKAEHLMLLDLARNDLGRVARVGSVQVTEFMKVERYSHVMHLVSTVESTVAEHPSIENLFRAVFPAGTVSGAPKIRALQIIDELEPHSRGLYAGSLGYFGSRGEVDHCIAIRCVLCSGQRYLFTAGAGIVADSIPEREYDEISNKVMALRMMLKMAEEPL